MIVSILLSLYIFAIGVHKFIPSSERKSCFDQLSSLSELFEQLSSSSWIELFEPSEGTLRFKTFSSSERKSWSNSSCSWTRAFRAALSLKRAALWAGAGAPLICNYINVSHNIIKNKTLFFFHLLCKHSQQLFKNKR